MTSRGIRFDVIPADDDGPALVLIDGSKAEIESLAELILAQAEDCDQRLPGQ